MPVANPAAIKVAGGDFSTIQAWEDALVNNEGVLVGECYGEVFAQVVFNGEAYDSSNYPHLTAHAGNEHDGRAHEVSAAGNARIEVDADTILINISDNWVRVSWLEIKGPGDNVQYAVQNNFVDASTIYFRHCIVHNNHAQSVSGRRGFQWSDTSPVIRMYRNIVYGYWQAGVQLGGGSAGSACLCNTFFQNNKVDGAFEAGIKTTDTSYETKDNACFANLDEDIEGTAGTLDYNFTSSAFDVNKNGANGEGSLTTADQFVNPTTTWADTDLLVKAGADLIDEATSFSAVTYPEIDVPIQNGATRNTVAGTWDIGAAEFVSGAGQSVVPLTMNHYRRLRAG